jgi:hypothetical protein
MTKKMETVMDNEILPMAAERGLLWMETQRHAKLFVMGEDGSWEDNGTGTVRLTHDVNVLDINRARTTS